MRIGTLTKTDEYELTCVEELYLLDLAITLRAVHFLYL
jgi:hypothetical protein